MADARSNLYGNATLFTSANIAIGTVFNADGCLGFPLGHNPDDRTKGLAFNLGPNGHPGHSLHIGSTRSGKGVSCIIPLLLSVATSCVVIDPKGENCWITAPRRRELGHKVIRLDPWNEVNKRYGNQVGITEPITRFNPLSSLDPKSDDFADDVAAIADALILPNSDTNSSHWVDSARDLVAGLIAAVVEENPGKASLRDVRELITAEDEELLKRVREIRAKNPKSLAGRKLRRFTQTAMAAEKLAAAKQQASPTGEPPPPGQPVGTSPIGPMQSNSEISSIRSTAETQTAIFDSETLLNAMETDETPFDLEELARGRVTLYLVLPVDRLGTHGRWLRLILTLAIRTIARQPKPPQMPVLFVLDEFGSVGPLQAVENSYSLMAGLNIRIAAFLQDLSQLQRDYPRSWQTFIANSSVIQILNCADDLTAEYFSKYLGNSTIEVNQGWSPHTRPTNQIMRKGKGNPNDAFGIVGKALMAANDASDAPFGGTKDTKQEVWEPDLSFHPRPVLFPWELRNSPRDTSIIIVPGQYNARLMRFVYWSDPVFSKYARPDPNKTPAAPRQAAATTAPVGENRGPRFDTVTGKQLW